MNNVSDINVKFYKNEDVVKIVGIIPREHQHLRLLIFFKDQVIVLHEATVAAIVRAYVNIVSHPTRRAVELIQTRLGKDVRKLGYAEVQLVDSLRSEDEILSEYNVIFSSTRK